MKRIALLLIAGGVGSCVWGGIDLLRGFTMAHANVQQLLKDKEFRDPTQYQWTPPPETVVTPEEAKFLDGVRAKVALQEAAMTEEERDFLKATRAKLDEGILVTLADLERAYALRQKAEAAKNGDAFVSREDLERAAAIKMKQKAFKPGYTRIEDAVDVRAAWAEASGKHVSPEAFFRGGRVECSIGSAAVVLGVLLRRKHYE